MRSNVLKFNGGNTLIPAEFIQKADFTPASPEAKTPATLTLTVHGQHHTFSGDEAEEAFNTLSDE